MRNCKSTRPSATKPNQQDNNQMITEGLTYPAYKNSYSNQWVILYNWWGIDRHQNLLLILTLFRIGLFGAAHRWGGQKIRPPQNLLHVFYNDKTWHIYTLRRSKKYINHPLSSADISIFSPGIGKFCYIKKYRHRLHLNHNF